VSGLTPEEEAELAALNAGTSDEDELAELNAQLPEPEPPSMLDSGLRGGLQGLTAGFSDELAGGLGSLVPGLDKEPYELAGDIQEKGWREGLFGGQESYEQVRDRVRGENAAAREANPWTYGVTEVAGDLVNPLNKLGGKLAGRVAQNAISGVGASEGKTAGEIARDAAGTAAVGEALGLGARGVAAGARAIAKSKPVQGLANRAAVKAAGGIQHNMQHLGQEEVEPLGKAMLDADLIPLPTHWENSKKKILDRSKAFKQKSWDKVESVLAFVDQETGKHFNWAQAKRNIDAAIGRMSPMQREMVAPMLERIARNFETNVAEGGGFAAANRMKSDLYDGINYKADPKLKTRMEKELVRALKEEIERQVGDVFGSVATRGKGPASTVEDLRLKAPGYGTPADELTAWGVHPDSVPFDIGGVMRGEEPTQWLANTPAASDWFRRHGYIPEAEGTAKEVWNKPPAPWPSKAAAAKTAGEDAAAQLRKANADYGTGTEAAKLARKGWNREMGNNQVSLTDVILGAGALGGGMSTGTGAGTIGGTGTGLGLIIANQLKRRRGDALVSKGLRNMTGATGATGSKLAGLYARETQRQDPDVYRPGVPEGVDEETWRALLTELAKGPAEAGKSATWWWGQKPR